MCLLIMAATLQIPIKREVHSVIRFLHEKEESPADIHHQITFVYANILNRYNVSKWCRSFSEGKTGVHEKHRTGRLSMISDALL